LCAPHDNHTGGRFYTQDLVPDKGVEVQILSSACVFTDRNSANTTMQAFFNACACGLLFAVSMLAGGCERGNLEAAKAEAELRELIDHGDAVLESIADVDGPADYSADAPAVDYGF
jgi:hypothetical protein